ncbi:cupin domain-containing protein [Streptosporangium sp. NPDC000396]|uniref:cupin domain-containing protein n=1 Tax=Streptosporangium sp. NPDC000396 TaxID=3366185 RepID=UPI00369D0D79
MTEAEEQGHQVDEIVSQIGPKLRGLRTAQRHSLQRLAVLSDVSAAAIHKIERNGMVPTITTLLKLGAALGVPVSYFVEEDEQPPEPVHYTPRDRRPTVYTPHEGLALAGITGSYRQFQTAAAVATVTPGASSGAKLMQHPGEELVHVTEGMLTFRVGDQTYPLAEGDSLHFGGDVPHHWANETDLPARAIWIALRNG